MEWLTKIQLHVNHLTLGEHPKAKHAFLDACVVAYCIKLSNTDSFAIEGGFCCGWRFCDVL